MMRGLFALVVAVAIIASGLVNPSVAQTPETAVVEKLLKAMQAKDATAIRSAFAPNASQQYGEGKPKTDYAFRAWVESDVIAAEPVVDDASVSATGDGVVVTGTISNNRGYRAKANFLFTIEGGKIKHWQIRY
jgi:ketosteroid isomerase-like protein